MRSSLTLNHLFQKLARIVPPPIHGAIELSPRTLQSLDEHVEVRAIGAEFKYEFHQEPRDTSKRAQVGGSERIAHRVNDASFHTETGLVFLGERLLVQSGQIYLDPVMDAVLNRVGRPTQNVKKKNNLNGEDFFVVPQIHAYWHWVVEWLPSILGIRTLSNTVRIVVNSGQPSYVVDGLRALGIEPLVVNTEWAYAENLWLINKSPFGTLHRHDLSRLREIAKNESWNDDKTLEKPIRLYVSRAGFSRSMRNEDLLESWLVSKGFQILRAENLIDLKHQARLFSKAEIVIGPSGSGLTNSVFLPEGAEVIELTSPLFDLPEYISLFQSIGVKHRRVFLEVSKDLPFGCGEQAIRELQRHFNA